MLQQNRLCTSAWLNNGWRQIKFVQTHRVAKLNSASVSRDIIGKLGQWRREINNWILMSKRNHRQRTTYCQLDVNFRIKNLRGNGIDCFEVNFEKRQHRRKGCRRPEAWKIRIFTSSCPPQPSRRWKVLLKNDFKTVNTVLLPTFNHKIYASNMQYVDSCLWFLFNVKI